VEISILH